MEDLPSGVFPAGVTADPSACAPGVTVSWKWVSDSTRWHAIGMFDTSAGVQPGHMRVEHSTSLELEFKVRQLNYQKSKMVQLVCPLFSCSKPGLTWIHFSGTCSGSKT